MNRRRSTKPQLSFGTVLLLIAAGVVIAGAGVFHAYVKNRQINVSREIQRAEQRISQHELDIKTDEMLLAQQLNRILLRNRLREMSSDLREIPVSMVREIDATDHPRQRAGSDSAVASLAPPNPSAAGGGP